jgi:4-hydroxybenzoate polyprenyltransferase
MLLRLVRWPGVLTAASNAAVGFLLAREAHALTGGAQLLGAGLGGALVYAGGVVLNDVADAERDRELHPSRPIPSGAVLRGKALAFGSALLIAGVVAVVTLCGLHAGSASAGAALCALAYDFGGKRFRWTGALLMALARGANALAGMLASAGSWGELVRIAEAATDVPAVVVGFPVAVACYTLALTIVSTFEDRPVISPTLAGGLAVFVAIVAAAPWVAFTARWIWGAGIPLALLAGTLVVGAREALRPDGPGVGMIVRQAVFGFLLVDAAWLFGRAWYDYGFGLVLVYVALRLVLARSRS